MLRPSGTSPWSLSGIPTATKQSSAWVMTSVCKISGGHEGTLRLLLPQKSPKEVWNGVLLVDSSTTSVRTRVITNGLAKLWQTLRMDIPQHLWAPIPVQQCCDCEIHGLSRVDPIRVGVRDPLGAEDWHCPPGHCFFPGWHLHYNV